MKEAIYGLFALTLFIVASSMDLEDAEREEAALAQHWIEIREAQQ